MEGGGHYGTEDAALVAGDQSGLRIRIKCLKTGEHKEAVRQEMASPDSGDWERPSDGGRSRADQSARGRDGELLGDEDANIESENHHLGDDDESPTSKAEEAVADNDVDDSCGSSKRKHANKGLEVPTCPECGKTFPSDKSLFGHLRCHPERDYRGANPPPNAKKKPRSDAYSSAARPLPMKWSTAKRGGRKGTADDDDPEAIAAGILLHLADAKYQGPKTTTAAKEETETKQVPATHFDGTDGLGWYQNSTDDKDADNYGNDVVSSYKRIKKRKIKELELAVNESIISPRGRKYQCSVCFKTFSSHQALGGHTASHNKNKSNPEEMAITDEIDGANVKNGEELVHSNNAVTKVANAEHRCTNCNQTFPTGQALGGHKRRHFNQLQIQAPSSSAHSSESDKGANHGLLQNRAPSSSAHSSEIDKGANHGLLQKQAASCSAHSSDNDKGANHGLFDFDLNEVPEL